MDTRSLAISVGVGGAVSGLLSAIPLLSCFNYLLCLWVWVGAILGVYIYTRMDQKTLADGDGAIIGALSGLVGALIVSGLSIVLGAAMAAMLTLPGDYTSGSMLSTLASQGIGLVAGIIANLVIFPGIGALAGLVGVQMFKPPVGL